MTIEAALARARDTAGEKDVRIGGGVATVRAVGALGGGEALFCGLDLPALGYAVESYVPGEAAMHLHVKRRPMSRGPLA